MTPFAVRSRWLHAAFAVLAAGVAFHAAHAVWGFGGPALSRFTTDYLYVGIEVLAVVVCAARALTGRVDRATWILLTVSMLTWTLGDAITTFARQGAYPAAADVLYLASYPCALAGVLLFLRPRRRHAGPGQWLDGAIVGLTAASVGAALVFSSAVGQTDGTTAVNVAYPLGDLALLAFVPVGYALQGWRPDRRWLLVGAGVGTAAAANMLYLYATARHDYTAGGLLDTMWPLAMVLVAAAAWQPAQRPRSQLGRPADTVVVPALAGIVALALLLVAAFVHICGLAAALAAAALLAAGVRAGLTYAENLAMLRRSAHEAVTDALTGLGNRRRMMECLEDCAAQTAQDGPPATLILFDLNGFKTYNDTFGHAAGDALLTRLAHALALSVGGRGQSFRPGGDEFCVLLQGRHDRSDQIVTAAAAALSEVGTRFTVTAAYGVVVLPQDTTSAGRALQLADERMYAHKAASGQSSRAITRDVLMQILSEREPGLHHHVHTVGELVVAVAQEFALDAEGLDEVLRAAELHDIGKLAIPDAILQKPGKLDEAEWRFMREHAVIGERILNTAPALRPVARLVRSSHERWDGGGYPDGLAGTDIPLGARIIAVCDAYEAMTSDRCYQAARSVADAVAELRRNAASQFDPDVVEAFCRVLTRIRVAPELPLDARAA